MSALGLTTRLQQTTKLSPKQIQVIRMLELPAVELRQRIDEELQSNPALEEGRAEEPASQQEEDSLYEDEYQDKEEEYVNPLDNEDFNYDDYVGDGDDHPDYPGANQSYSVEIEDNRESNYTGGSSLMEHLKGQVYLTKMDKPQRHIAKWVLGNIDNDGFLRRTVEQLVDDLSFQEGLQVSDEEMADIVAQIKMFDPAGVAAYNLQECLINQLKQKHQSEAVVNALRILTNCFDSFSKRHFNKVCQRLDLSDEQLKQAIDEIVHLNQKPANAYSGNSYEGMKQTIIPDFRVDNRDGELVLTVNTGDIPELHISEQYQQMHEMYKHDKEATRFIKQKLDSAEWFIDAIQQRNETLQRTMAAIVDFQRDFFMEGDDSYLKPMILQDIADRTGYDVSTISRVSNSKYVQTEYGIYPLKHFFSEAMMNLEGDEISTREIKQILGEVISKEDRQNPLNDDQLVAILLDHGYPVARRTIAKYRDQMGIPVARLRKEA